MWIQTLIGVFVVTNVYTLPQLGQEIRSSNAVYSSSTPVPIVTQHSSSDPNGSFNISYETGNGIKVQNAGYIKRVIVPRHEDENGRIVEEHEQEILVQSGVYSYPDPDGNLITLSYIADENGFQPSGDHIPQPPSVNHVPFHQNRPIQPLPPQHNLNQDVSSVPSQNFQELVQDRPIQQQQQFPNQPGFQQFPQSNFNQRRFRRQFELNQEREIEQRDHHDIPQERPIQEGPYQEIPQDREIASKRIARQIDFQQERTALRRNQELPQDRPIQPRNYQELPQNRPIQHRTVRQLLQQEVRSQEAVEERPIQTYPSGGLYEDRPIQSGPYQSSNLDIETVHRSSN